jgi:predicted nucleic acid-binding protein
MRGKVICDAGSLISLSLNCMLPIITELSEKTDFVIPKGVYDEIITNPHNIKRFKLGSLKFSALVKEGVIAVEEPDAKLAGQILDLSNRIYWVKKHPLSIIQRGEAEALAMCVGGGTLLIDERTMRLLVEHPASMVSLLRKRMNRNVHEDPKRLSEFQSLVGQVPIIRSSEVIAVAYERGILEKYFRGERREVLESCLWALKFSGCALTHDEIQEYLRIQS